MDYSVFGNVPKGRAIHSILYAGRFPIPARIAIAAQGATLCFRLSMLRTSGICVYSHVVHPSKPITTTDPARRLMARATVPRDVTN